MALFEEKPKDDTYIALLAEDGETLVAFVSPVKNVSKELLVEAMSAKGLNVELRERADTVLDIKL